MKTNRTRRRSVSSVRTTPLRRAIRQGLRLAQVVGVCCLAHSDICAECGRLHAGGRTTSASRSVRSANGVKQKRRRRNAKNLNV